MASAFRRPNETLLVLCLFYLFAQTRTAASEEDDNSVGGLSGGGGGGEKGPYLSSSAADPLHRRRAAVVASLSSSSSSSSSGKTAEGFDNNNDDDDDDDYRRNKPFNSRRPLRRARDGPPPPPSPPGSTPPAVSGCPEPCFCTAWSIDCSQRRLRFLPSAFFVDGPYMRNVAELDLSGNPLGSIPPNRFVNLTALRRLSLSNMSLSAVEASAFSGLASSLEDLDLSHNALSSLRPEVLRAVPRLLRLRLDHNAFDLSAVDAALRHATRLQRLSVGANRDAARLRLGNHFRRLRALKSLSLDGNKIGRIEAGSLEPLRDLSNLRELDLSRCGLRSVHEDALRSLPRGFESLNLAFNPDLTNSRVGGDDNVRNILRGLQEVSTLVSLNLSAVDLTSVSNSTFDFLSGSRLRSLDLSRNRLSAFDDPLLALDLPHLRRLDLSRNRVGTVGGLSGLTGLERLDLARNRLSQVPREAAALPALRTLDLGFNGITTLSTRDFADGRLTNLETLSVRGNKLKALAPAGLFRGLRGLKSLDLSQNRLENVAPGVFLDLPSLKVLDLSFNRLWVSDAEIFSQLLVDTLSSLRLEGNSFDCSCEGVDFLRWLNSSDAALGDIKGDGFACKQGRMPLLLFRIEMRTMCGGAAAAAPTPQPPQPRPRRPPERQPGDNVGDDAVSTVAPVVAGIGTGVVVLVVLVVVAYKAARRKLGKSDGYAYGQIAFVNQIYGSPTTAPTTTTTTSLLKEKNGRTPKKKTAR